MFRDYVPLFMQGPAAVEIANVQQISNNLSMINNLPDRNVKRLTKSMQMRMNIDVVQINLNLN